MPQACKATGSPNSFVTWCFPQPLGPHIRCRIPQRNNEASVDANGCGVTSSTTILQKASWFSLECVFWHREICKANFQLLSNGFPCWVSVTVKGFQIESLFSSLLCITMLEVLFESWLMSLECGWMLVLTFRRGFPSLKEEGSLTPLQPVYNEFIHPGRNRVLSDMRLCKMWANTGLIKVEEAKGEIPLSRSLLVLEFACFLGEEEWAARSKVQHTLLYALFSLPRVPAPPVTPTGRALQCTPDTHWCQLFPVPVQLSTELGVN